MAGLLFAFYPEHICYSHYLWSEILLTPLIVLSVYFFAIFAKDRQQNKYLFLSFIIAGFGLLTKEFAFAVMAGLMVALFFMRPQKLLSKAVVCFALFMLPAVIYSVTISCITKRPVFLSDAPIGNFRIAVGVESNLLELSKTYEDSFSELIKTLKQRSLAATLKNAKKQFFNLWTPNSFAIYRILSEPPHEWTYGIPIP